MAADGLQSEYTFRPDCCTYRVLNTPPCSPHEYEWRVIEMLTGPRKGRSYCLDCQRNFGCGTQRELRRVRVASTWNWPGLATCVWFAGVAVGLGVLFPPAG